MTYPTLNAASFFRLPSPSPQYGFHLPQLNCSWRLARRLMWTIFCTLTWTLPGTSRNHRESPNNESAVSSSSLCQRNILVSRTGAIYKLCGDSTGHWASKTRHSHSTATPSATRQSWFRYQSHPSCYHCSSSQALERPSFLLRFITQYFLVSTLTQAAFMFQRKRPSIAPLPASVCFPAFLFMRVKT